jgi:hypothetical protein
MRLERLGTWFTLIIVLALALAAGGMPPLGNAGQAATPPGHLLRFSGQLLDYRKGYVYFTTGDGFRVDPKVKIDNPNGGATTLEPATRIFARAAFDTGNGAVVELALSKTQLPTEASYEAIKPFAVSLSTTAPNPDLHGGEGFSGRQVLVVFTVQVPSKTPFGDSIYIATDVSGWSATAIRMDRIDALHYRVSQDFASGTHFLYRYTRGSWRSAERGQDGLEVPPRQFTVRDADTLSVSDVVYHWGDEDQSQPNLGSTIPTPFNPLPFNTPPHK